VALWFGGSVSDRWGRMRALIPGLLIYAVLLGSMSQLTHPAILAGCSLAVGAAAGFVAAIPTALTSDQVDRPFQGVAVAWLRTMSDSGQIAGPLVMGALADAIDLSAVFRFGAALLAVVALSCRRHTNLLPANAVTG
jgi:MFS family permease